MKHEQNTSKDYALVVALEALAYAKVHSRGQVEDAINHAIETIKKAFNKEEAIK